MAALDDLAHFLVHYIDPRPGRPALSIGCAVEMILSSDALGGDLARQAALYGLADEVRATEADGFDSAWRPT